MRIVVQLVGVSLRGMKQVFSVLCVAMIFVAGCEGSEGNADDEVGTSEETDDGDSTDEGQASCMDVDCSGHGTCVEVEGEAICECEQGYAADGLDCIPCPEFSGTFDIDVPMITLSGNRTINGQSITAPGSAVLHFVDPDSGDRASTEGLDEATYSIELVPGTYDVVYDVVTVADGIPHNTSATIMSGLSLQTSGALDIDVPMVELSGLLTVNGVPFDAPGSGMIRFVNSNTGDAAALDDIGGSDYFIELVPGVYDVVYDVAAPVDGIPHNTSAEILSDVSLEASGSFDIDIPMITVSGTRTINGQTVTMTDAGYLYFVGPDSVDRVALGGFDDGDYSVDLVPGVYDIVYEITVPTGGIPQNTHAVIAEDVSLMSSGGFDIDVPMITVSGSRTVNGQAVSAPGSGILYFVDPSTGDRASLGSLEDSTYSVELVPGTYDIVYELGAEADGVPHNMAAVLVEGVSLGSSGSFDIDIPMITVSGARTINGAAVDAPGSGVLRFVNPESGDIASLDDLDADYSIELVPGTYDIVYDVSAPADNIPHNTRGLIVDQIALMSSGSLDIDIPMREVSGNRTINGQSVTEAASAVLRFVDRLSGDIADIGPMDSPTYSVEVVPGTYEVVYDMSTPASGIPHNTFAVLECIYVP
jgi:hypothetical protein